MVRQGPGQKKFVLLSIIMSRKKDCGISGCRKKRFNTNPFFGNH